MRDGVEGHTQTEEDENSEKTGVSCQEEVVCDFDWCRFSAMEGIET